MMKKNWCFFSLHLLFILLLIGRSAVSSKHLIGISPLDEKYYTATLIECKDGSHKKFNKSQLNDNFCDCPGGTGEPGTSSMSQWKILLSECRTFSSLSIYSSRVNDGICDCCDGSDEYDGKIECPNTCWEAGRVARDRLKIAIATYQEGVTLRKQEVERAKLAAAKDEAELSKLENEEKILKGLVQQLQDRKEQIDKAEEKERLQKEKEKEEREKRC